MQLLATTSFLLSVTDQARVVTTGPTMFSWLTDRESPLGITRPDASGDGKDRGLKQPVWRDVTFKDCSHGLMSRIESPTKLRLGPWVGSHTWKAAPPFSSSKRGKGIIHTAGHNCASGIDLLCMNADLRGLNPRYRTRMVMESCWRMRRTPVQTKFVIGLRCSLHVGDPRV